MCVLRVLCVLDGNIGEVLFGRVVETDTPRSSSRLFWYQCVDLFKPGFEICGTLFLQYSVRFVSRFVDALPINSLDIAWDFPLLITSFEKSCNDESVRDMRPMRKYSSLR
jgi:hypothetical protein